jgi:dTDP-glucose 4,6-dehydratase
LVTGGLGFIGSNFILHTIQKGFSNITNLDAVFYGAVPENLTEIENRRDYRFVKGNTADRKMVEQLMRNVDVVVHFAAESHVDRSITRPENFLHNVVGTFTVLEAARTAGVKRFVHISTDEVYGSASAGTSFNEGSVLHTSSPYSASKAASDMFVAAYHTTYGLNTVTLRCTNNFGPRQFPEKFIPKTIISALLGRKIPIYGDGIQIRDWIYVLDFCRAIDLAIEKGKAGSLYNVSASNELPNIQVVTAVLEQLNKSNDLIQFVEDRPGHDFRYSLDSSRIRKDLGWRPQEIFADALRQTVQWYVDNERWWKPLITDRVLSAAPWKEKQ